MRALRLVLFLFSAGGAAFMIYLFFDEGGGKGLSALYAVGLILNLVFLWRAGVKPAESPGRLVRIVRLWLDVKEADLKRRATL